MVSVVANSAMMSALTICYQWEDRRMRERTGHAPSYAEVKTTKLLKLIPIAALELA